MLSSSNPYHVPHALCVLLGDCKNPTLQGFQSAPPTIFCTRSEISFTTRSKKAIIFSPALLQQSVSQYVWLNGLVVYSLWDTDDVGSAAFCERYWLVQQRDAMYDVLMLIRNISFSHGHIN